MKHKQSLLFLFSFIFFIYIFLRLRHMLFQVPIFNIIYIQNIYNTSVHKQSLLKRQLSFIFFHNITFYLIIFLSIILNILLLARTTEARRMPPRTIEVTYPRPGKHLLFCIFTLFIKLYRFQKKEIDGTQLKCIKSTGCL